MNISHIEPLAINVDFDENAMWVQLADGRRLGVPLAFFPRLYTASPDQLKTCVISGGGRGLHWEALDEDISVRGLLLGLGDQTVGDMRKTG
ncbi:MAG TPA: DUF2442 domain-containing protein [Candidatus Ozemobacteraceae bacterium]